MISILCLAIIVWIIFSLRQDAPITNIDSTNTTIIAFGDSLVYGVGSTPAHDFISLLSAKIGQPIINLGVSGDTTRKGLVRIDEVTAQKPRIVILLLGGNDYLQKIPQDETFTNLATIIEKIHSSGSAVLLLGVRGGLLRDTYADRFAEFAKEQRVGFVPNILDGLITDTRYMSDAIHPNDIGYAKIAEKIEPVLQRMLRGEN